jgi:hypothetical protein
MAYTRTKAQSYHDTHPTGYKHCSACGCWRPVSDFGVAKWVDIERTLPLKLASKCRTCDARRAREKHGYTNRRDAYKYGPPGSDLYRRNFNARRRVIAKERYAAMTPEQREIKNEYLRIFRNAKRGSVARLTKSYKPVKGEPDIRVDERPFLTWLSRQEDPYLTETEARIVRAVRAGDGDGMRLGVIDAIMTRAGDGYLVAVLYPLDDEQAA